MKRTIRVRVEPSRVRRRVWLKAVTNDGHVEIIDNIPRECAVDLRNKLVEKLSNSGVYDEVIGDPIIMKNQPEVYKAIRVWHATTGSKPYYWKNLQAQAAEEGAPVDALYQRHENKVWVTVRDLAPDHPFHKTLAEAK